jgi:hypothetical protein
MVRKPMAAPGQGDRMTRPTRALLALAAAAASLGAGCSKGSEAPPVPAGLTVREGSDLDHVYLTWEPACQDCGYELLYTVAGQAQLAPGRFVSPGTTSAYGTFSAATPELLVCQFQIRAVRGRETSGWSAPVEYQRGIRPPTVSFGAYSEVAGQRISWVNASLVADRLVVEREASGGPVATLTSTFGATSLDDAGFMEATVNVYRVR